MKVENTARESQRFPVAPRPKVSDTPSIQSSRQHRIAIVAAFAIGGFLLGFVTMSWISAGYRAEIASLLRTRQLNVLQNDLATATINARRGEFEQARQQTGSFFTDLDAELRSNESAFTTEQHEAMQSILKQRDDMITTLARSDPASGDGLTGLYFNYLQVKNSGMPMRTDSR